MLSQFEQEKLFLLETFLSVLVFIELQMKADGMKYFFGKWKTIYIFK
jgi:hypothetical protein